MKYLTEIECYDWCKNHNINIDSDRKPVIKIEGLDIIGFTYPIFTQFVYLSSILSTNALKDEECLLWITQTSIWKSSENFHLYYKLRESYSDSTKIEEKPGHLFSLHESDDLKSFLYLNLLFGWDCYLLSAKDSIKAFCSHDEWIELLTTDTLLIQILNERFIKGKES